jgi:Fe2+ transport system protein FeoA
MPLVRLPVPTPFARRRSGETPVRRPLARVSASPPQRGIPLTRLKPGTAATVVRIGSADAGRAVRLSSLGLVPGADLLLVQRRPAVVLRVGETAIAVDEEVADEIFVDPASPVPDSDAPEGDGRPRGPLR